MSRARQSADRGHHLSGRLVAEVVLDSLPNLNTNPELSELVLEDYKNYRIVFFGAAFDSTQPFSLYAQLSNAGVFATANYRSQWLMQGVGGYDGGGSAASPGVYCNSWNHFGPIYSTDMILMQSPEDPSYIASLSGSLFGFVDAPTNITYATGTFSGHTPTAGPVDGIRIYSAESGRLQHFIMQAYELPRLQP